MSERDPTQPEAARPRRERDDETVRTVLGRAMRRAKTVAERCGASSTLRPPAAGPVDHVDPARVAHLRPTPRDVERIDRFELGLAGVIGIAKVNKPREPR